MPHDAILAALPEGTTCIAFPNEGYSARVAPLQRHVERIEYQLRAHIVCATQPTTSQSVLIDIALANSTVAAMR